MMDRERIIESSIDILTKLIAFRSESHLSNLSLIAYIKNYIKETDKENEAQLHLSYNEDKSKANILVSLPDSTGSIKKGILLSGHTDVVPTEGQHWQTDPYQMTQKEDHLYGRGSCDMKGFVAVCLALFPYFITIQRTQPLHMSFSFDEETGCLGAMILSEHMRTLGIIPSIAIIGEPTLMEIVIGHKGCCEYDTLFTGLPGHSSLPDNGVNAIEYATYYANELLSLSNHLKESAPKDCPFYPPYTTLQIGKIEGGSAHNIIAEHCRVGWQMRPINKQDAELIHQHMDHYADTELLPKMQAVYPQARIQKTSAGEIEGLEPLKESPSANYLSRLMGKQKTGVVSYGTEAGIFQNLGASAVVCGPGSIDQAHKADEFIAISQLEQCAHMLWQIKEDIERL